MKINLFEIRISEVGRMKHLQQNQFLTRSEFCVRNYSIFSFSKIMNIMATEALEKDNNDFFILCQEDDFLTVEYNQEKLISIVNEGNLLGADLIFGGTDSFTNCIMASENLFWVDYCDRPSFAIILKKFYSNLFSNTEFQIINLQDLNDFTDNKYLVFPFVSIKKNIELTFKSLDKLRLIKNINAYYSSKEVAMITDYDICIPTYIINLESRKDRLSNIIQEFENRSEFETHIIKACVHDIGAVGLFKSIREIIKMAVKNDDDVIIIVEDDHVFTGNYDRNTFIKNVFEAGYQGADILSGGISGGFQYVVPLTKGRFWINHFWGTQFIVVYRKFFQTILEADFGNTDTADDFLSDLSTNKMVISPFISVQMDFGYSDITTINELRGDLSKIFVNAEKKLETISQAYEKNTNWDSNV